MFDQHDGRSQFLQPDFVCQRIAVGVGHVQRVEHSVAVGTHHDTLNVDPAERQSVGQFVEEPDRVFGANIEHGEVAVRIGFHVDFNG